MLLLVFLVFAVLAILAFMEDRLTDLHKGVAFLVLITFMAMMVGLRPDDFDKDYSSYVSLYNNPYTYDIEVSFMFIAYLVRQLSDDVVLMFLIYAFLALIIHSFAVKRLTELWFLSLLMYAGTYFLLHGMNQIRVGVAAAIFLMALPHLKSGERKKYFLYAVCATLFHYSACILFFFSFFGFQPMKRWQYFFYLGVIPFAYMLYLAHVNILVTIPIPYFEEKLKIYQTLQEQEGKWTDINVFNLVLLTKIVIIYFLLWKSKLIHEHNEYGTVLLKIEVLSIAAFVMLYELPVLAFRICELLGIVEIILFPMLYYTVKPSWVGKTLVTVVATCLLLINIYYNGYVNV